MKFKCFILVVVCCALSNKPVFSQSKKTDSLWLVLKHAKEDTAKVNNLIALGKQFRTSDIDSALYFAYEALALATQLNYEMGIADSKEGYVHCMPAWENLMKA